MIKLVYNGKEKSYDDWIVPAKVLADLQVVDVSSVVAVELDGKVYDLMRKIPPGAYNLSLITADSEKGLEVMRHSCAHVMAEAIKQLFPGTKLGVGPTIENGFYYDVLPPTQIRDEHLPKIEEEMRRLVQKNSRFERIEKPRDEALDIAKKAGEDFKVEIINQIDPKDSLSFYKDGDFMDLCRGPHIPSTSWIKAFKLTKISGAYWKGDEKNVMLTRIYGIAFDTEDKLKKHFELLEKAKEIDHRKLGMKLDIFSSDLNIGPGLTLWHPNGAVIKYLIEKFWYDLHLNCDYQIVSTPHIATEDLFKISGHLENYKDFMYGGFETDNRTYRLKPMNCPFHITIYRSTNRSYKELPIRYAEMGTVYRYEKGGVMHGLMRVRGFTIDDAHVFVAPDQVEEEVNRIYDLTLNFLGRFGFKGLETQLSTRPKEFIGTIEEWNSAEKSLENVLKGRGVKYGVELGGGAFYGPKISVYIKDSLGRSWQCSTIQLDFNLPQRFKLQYADKTNTQSRPIIIHRALMGSVERFIGVLIEHYEGKFPYWLAPVQVKVLTVGKDAEEYAKEVQKILKDNSVRVKLDSSDDRIGGKIRVAIDEKVPVIAVLGVKESQERSANLRIRGSEKQTVVKLSELIQFLSSVNS
ncbi:MAG: threonine--tRNA ligase [Planctomycetes bacterium]|nr:threonine--tRNA ligase [Planctomycetota bacterium]